MAGRWSAEEEGYLRESSSSHTIAQMAEHLGRTHKAVYYRCEQLGLTPIDGRRSDQPKATRKPPRFRIDDEGRECSKCGAYKPWSEYHAGNGARQRNSQCMACESAYHSSRYYADIEASRAYGREVQRRHMDKVNPDRNRFVPCQIDEDGRECPRCRKYKSWAEFHTWKKADGHETSVCKPCWREATRKHRYLRTYGITVEQFEWLEGQQQGLCALCHSPEIRVHPRSGELFYLSIDHYHECGRHAPERACEQCIRGLLCYGCNGGLGLLEGKPYLLSEEVAKYLRKRPLLAHLVQ
jgi:hypothetical protein